MTDQCPCGKTKICGTIVAIQPVANFFSLGVRITVRDEHGYCVCGILPKELSHLIEWKLDRYINERLPSLKQRNPKVEFEATVIPSETDEHFGFFKKPHHAISL